MGRHSVTRMDGCMYGWMGEWVDTLLQGWMVECTGGWANG